MRVAILLLLLICLSSLSYAVKTKRRTVTEDLSNDECPAGCMNGSRAMNLLAELATCEIEQRNLRQRIRNQGHEDFDVATSPGSSAADILGGLLRDTEKLATHRQKCSKCIAMACAEPAVTRFLTDSTEVLVFDGRRAHACKGCKCAYREMADHTREQYQKANRQRISRAQVVSTPTVAIITDHALYDQSPETREVIDGMPKVGRAVARKLRQHERDCFTADEDDAAHSNNTIRADNSIMESHFGRGAIRTYIAELNQDNSLGRLSIFVYRHDK